MVPKTEESDNEIEDEEDDVDDFLTTSGDDPITPYEDDISESDSDDCQRRPSAESVVQDSLLNNHNILSKRGGIISLSGESPKEFNQGMRDNLNLETPNKNTINLSPILSPTQELASLPNGPRTEDDFQTAHLDFEEGEFGATALKEKQLSGKLKTLLSRNIPIADKLANQKTISKSKDGEDGKKKEEHTKFFQPTIQARLTRSQSRLMVVNSRRSTRASSRGMQSENSFASVEVANRLEDVGTKCGFRKRKEDKIGAFYSN
ncbi:hypothetical protein L2E82_35820 [Cichorium intybus]|uniref:Uncharacterized protein n=1 Tax=Cichorium intybus TaxID=13427 RepID=A0ACB9BPX2_CICIN|nr:hypothetical protein L2E82_35820 [Cichorium intybus]